VLIGSVEAALFLLLVVIVFGPPLAERFRIPGLVGLIAGGMLFGPFVLGWLPAEGVVADLGAIGILYLMFLAGLGFDLGTFRANRSSAVVYGLLGFVVPFGLSIWVGMAALGLGFLGASLIGAMWASNTLIAFPLVLAAGLQRNRAASTALSAGVAFDLMSLTVLAVATSTAIIDLESPTGVRATVSHPTLPIWIAVPLLLAFTLWILPRLTTWFFVGIGQTRMQRFVFALAGMAAGATVALLGGIEGLIGAFLAGLGMNLRIPTRGPLMNRLEFVGNAIFVPAFMVSIGLSINPAVLFDLETIRMAVFFTAIVVVGKTVAAIATGLAFGFSSDEIGLMASLSFGQAASTLAIAQVGSGLGLFGQDIVNASVLTIVATALITSYATRFFVGRVPLPTPPAAALGETIAVDVRPRGSDLRALMLLAAAIAQSDNGLVVPYAVPEPGHKDVARRLVDAAVAAASALGLDADGIVRIDESFADGTLHLVEEFDASLLVLSWTGPRFPTDYLFGAQIDRIGPLAPVPTIAARVLRPWRRVIVAIGHVEAAWHDEDARLTMSVVRRLRRARPVPTVVVSPEHDLIAETVGPTDGVELIDEDRDRPLVDIVRPDDLVVAPAYVLQRASVIGRRRIAQAFADVDLAIVAGPHRLTLSTPVLGLESISAVHP